MMYDEYGGGRLFYASDEDVQRMTRGFDLNEVCRYHRDKGGVMCDQKKRFDAMCAHCGWNPRVSRMRIRKYLERKEKQKLESDIV